MQALFSYTSFRTYLADEFKFRTKRNDLYSLRAFARDLSLSHSRLSEFLSGKSPLSARSGKIICEALALDEIESNYLIDLIKAEFHPNESVRKASAAAAELRRQTKTVVSRGDAPDVLERWYYIPVIELLTLAEPPTLAEIASGLGLEEATLKEAIDFLTRAGFLDRDGNRFHKSHAFMKFETGLPSPHFKAYHESFMQLARRALYTQEIERRKFTTWVFTLDDAELKEARQDLEDFSANFVRKFADRKTSNSVYSLGIQFFDVGRMNEKA